MQLICFVCCKTNLFHILQAVFCTIEFYLQQLFRIFKFELEMFFFVQTEIESSYLMSNVPYNVKFVFQALGLHIGLNIYIPRLSSSSNRFFMVVQSVIVLVHPNLVQVRRRLQTFTLSFCWHHVLSFVKAWKGHERWNQLENLLSQLGCFNFINFFWPKLSKMSNLVFSFATVWFKSDRVVQSKCANACEHWNILDSSKKGFDKISKNLLNVTKFALRKLTTTPFFCGRTT